MSAVNQNQIVEENVENVVIKSQRKPVLQEKFQKQMTFGFYIIKQMMDNSFISNDVQLRDLCEIILRLNDSVEDQKEFYENFETLYKESNTTM
jgi:hypothetical protein